MGEIGLVVPPGYVPGEGRCHRRAAKDRYLRPMRSRVLAQGRVGGGALDRSFIQHADHPRAAVNARQQVRGQKVLSSELI